MAAALWWFGVGLLVAVLGVYFAIAAYLYWRDVRNRW